MLDKRQGSRFRATLFQLPTAMGKGILVTPTVEQTLILGPTAEDISDKDDVRTTAPKLAEILAIARRTWPDIPGDQFITAFSGLRAHADRDDFIVGQAPDVPGLFSAAGIESPGLTAAPAIATDLAAQIAAYLADVSLGTVAAAAEFRPPPPAAIRFHSLDNPARSDLVRTDPAYGRIICRCEQISEAEIRAAIRRPLGARTLDGVKRRTRAGMGRCQGGFCTPRVLAILSEELGVSPLELTKFGGHSQILTGRIGEGDRPGEAWHRPAERKAGDDQ
jgi:glycerol-3-phosphate dehydrogenase